jgi:hypothetical protein
MPPTQINVPAAPAPSPLGVLKLEGSKIVGSDGKPVLLRGAGLGGHLNMENCEWMQQSNKYDSLNSLQLYGE